MLPIMPHTVLFKNHPLFRPKQLKTIPFGARQHPITRTKSRSLSNSNTVILSPISSLGGSKIWIALYLEPFSPSHTCIMFILCTTSCSSKNSIKEECLFFRVHLSFGCTVFQLNLPLLLVWSPEKYLHGRRMQSSNLRNIRSSTNSAEQNSREETPFVINIFLSCFL